MLITALITPFLGRMIDMDGMRSNIRRQLQAGIDGLVVLGTTGEAPSLSAEEEKELVQATVEEAGGRCLVMVGTGSNCTGKAIEKTLLAAELGADQALVVTPYYNRPSQHGLLQHFQMLADASPIPICLYNHPLRCGSALELDTVVQLASHPKITGIKEASGCINFLDACVQETDLDVFAGDDSMTLPAMALGAKGTISVLANLLPEEMLRLCQSSGEKALELHRALRPHMQRTSIEGNPVPIKAMMEACGLPAGPCRPPLAPLSPLNKELIIKEYHLTSK